MYEWSPQPATAWSGASIPSQRLSQVALVRASRPVVSDKSPGPSALQKRIPTKMETSETSEVFIKREKIRTVCVDRCTGRLRRRVPESHSHSGLNYFYRAFLLGFLWPVIWLAWFTVHIWYISGSSYVCACIFKPRWVLLKRHIGSLALISITPLWPPRSFSAHVWLRRSPDFWSKKYFKPKCLCSGCSMSLFKCLVHLWMTTGRKKLTHPFPEAGYSRRYLQDWKWKWNPSVMSNSATTWTVAYQAPPSMEFSRQEYWSRLPFPSPGDLPDPGIKPGSPG